MTAAVGRLASFAARHRRFLLFCVVGASGVVVNMIIFRAVLWAWPGVPHVERAAGSLALQMAATAGWFVSVATNFLLNERFTFQDGASTWQTSRLGRLLRYYPSAAVAFALQLIVLNGVLYAVESFGAPLATVAPWRLLWRVRADCCNLMGIAVGTVANYLLARNWVFR